MAEVADGAAPAAVTVETAGAGAGGPRAENGVVGAAPRPAAQGAGVAGATENMFLCAYVLMSQ